MAKLMDTHRLVQCGAVVIKPTRPSPWIFTLPHTGLNNGRNNVFGGILPKRVGSGVQPDGDQNLWPVVQACIAACDRPPYVVWGQVPRPQCDLNRDRQHNAYQRPDVMEAAYDDYYGWIDACIREVKTHGMTPMVVDWHGFADPPVGWGNYRVVLGTCNGTTLVHPEIPAIVASGLERRNIRTFEPKPVTRVPGVPDFNSGEYGIQHAHDMGADGLQAEVAWQYRGPSREVRSRRLGRAMAAALNDLPVYEAA